METQPEKKPLPPAGDGRGVQRIGTHTFEEYVALTTSFHGHPAPGVLLGGVMVDLALSRLPEGILFDAICETRKCLPDAIQMLTPCTVGNGWMRIMHFGRYALSLFEKFEGQGVRVFLDADKLEKWETLYAWFFKTRPKKEQSLDRIQEEIRLAGTSILGVSEVQVAPSLLVKDHLGKNRRCPVCREAFPAAYGQICRACQGKTPYVQAAPAQDAPAVSGPPLAAVPVEESVGKKALHDMTRIVPGQFKGPVVKSGQTIAAGDVCRLQRMGRNRVFVEDDARSLDGWVHENRAAEAFAARIPGEGVAPAGPPREGKIDFIAEQDGLLMVETGRLENLNMVPGVICATRKGLSIVSKGRKVAGTRAIPLYLPEADFQHALSVLDDGPLLRVLPLRKARVGILVTGTEVFQGLVKDRFIPILTAKAARFGCEVLRSAIAPDDCDAIRRETVEMVNAGCDLIITTAGLSVDPDDVTRKGLVEAGATDMLYGAPILPGAMLLLARIGDVQVMGVPACALYYETTSFDLLFPRLLAGVPVTRRDLAALGHGALCWECKQCTFPKCAFGKA